jgi:hypothetical protein
MDYLTILYKYYNFLENNSIVLINIIKNFHKEKRQRVLPMALRIYKYVEFVDVEVYLLYASSASVTSSCISSLTGIILSVR